jgi:hypothetical protein
MPACQLYQPRSRRYRQRIGCGAVAAQAIACLRRRGDGAVSADADAVDDDRDRCRQGRQILVGIVVVGHQRRRLPGSVERLAEEALPGGGRGRERGGWVESVFGQQCDLSGDGPGGVCPSKYGHAEAVREREQLVKPLLVVGGPPPDRLRCGAGNPEHRAQRGRPRGPGLDHQSQRRLVNGRAVLDGIHACPNQL